MDPGRTQGRDAVVAPHRRRLWHRPHQAGQDSGICRAFRRAGPRLGEAAGRILRVAPGRGTIRPMDRIRILRSAIGWAGRHAVSLLVAVAALGVAAEFGPALAQSADLLLARALHIDGDVSTGATDRAVVIQGDDGAD